MELSVSKQIRLKRLCISFSYVSPFILSLKSP
jgi:hypothetical protein